MSIDPLSQPRPRPQSNALLLAIIVASLAGLFLVFFACAGVFLLPAVSSSAEAARRNMCTNNLKQIGAALLAYHDQHNSFPPAYLPDDEGRPMHSWRVLLLPHFGDAELTRAYMQYNFDQPWNSQQNLAVAQRIDRLTFRPYMCPSAGDTGETNYMAIVGPGTAWPAPSPRRLRDVIDGTSQTILLVEVAGTGIPWMQPVDLTPEHAAAGINKKSGQPAPSSRHAGGVNTLYCDSSVGFLPDDTPPETVRGLITVAGGEDVKLPE